MELLWIAVVVIALITVCYIAYAIYRVFLRIEEALRGIDAASRSQASYAYIIASQTTQTSANVKYFVEFHEAEHGYYDELRRQALLRDCRREQLSNQVTPIAPIMTPVTPPAWIGDQAMAARRMRRP